MGIKEVEYHLIEKVFTPTQEKLAKQWISESANGLTLENDLRYIVDKLEAISKKFVIHGQEKYIPVEYAAKAKALYVEAEQLAVLGIRVGNPSLTHLQSKVLLQQYMPLVGYS